MAELSQERTRPERQDPHHEQGKEDSAGPEQTGVPGGPPRDRAQGEGHGPHEQAQAPGKAHGGVRPHEHMRGGEGVDQEEARDAEKPQAQPQGPYIRHPPGRLQNRGGESKSHEAHERHHVEMRHGRLHPDVPAGLRGEQEDAHERTAYEEHHERPPGKIPADLRGPLDPASLGLHDPPASWGRGSSKKRARNSTPCGRRPRGTWGCGPRRGARRNP